MESFNLDNKFTRSNLLSIIFSGIVLLYILSLLLFLTPNYIILENRVMYERVYDLNDQIEGNGFDLVIGILLFFALVLLFYRRLKLLGALLAAFVGLITIFQVLGISIHDANILLTPLLLIIWFVVDNRSFKVSIFRSSNFFYISIILIGIISICYSFSYMYGVLPIQDRVISFPVIWFSIASQVTPYLFILLFLLAAYQLLLRLLKNHSKLAYQSQPITKYSLNSIKKRSLFIAISGILLISILVTLIPHLPGVNPENRFVGYDSGYYITWIREIDKGENIGELLSIALQQSSGDRFLSLIIIFGVHWITAIDIEDMIEYIPLILAPLLAFVTYLLTYEISRNSRISLIASFLTPFSIQVSMGIYSGFYSNWIAIIIAYTTIIFFIKACKGNKSFYYTLLFIGLTSLCFTHIYTWLFFVICLGISILFVAKYHNPKVGLQRCILIVVILASSSIGSIVPWLASGNVAGFHNFMDLYNNDFEEFTWIFLDLFDFVVLVSHGGLFSNIMIPFLCIVFIFSLRRQHHNIFIYCIVVLLALATLTIFFGELEFKTRILYNIPFQIPAAIGLFVLHERTKKMLVTAACSLLIVAYSLHALTNFYLIPPEIMYPQDFSN